MIPNLKPIKLKELKLLDSTRFISFEGFLDNLPSINPIKGTIEISYQIKSIKVKGIMSTFIELECDRCLSNYKQKLIYNSEEVIWIASLAENVDEQKTNLGIEEIDDFLDPEEDFDPQHWVFEQLSLQTPLVKHCGKNCEGLSKLPREFSSDINKSNEMGMQDPRLLELKKLLIK